MNNETMTSAARRHAGQVIVPVQVADRRGHAVRLVAPSPFVRRTLAAAGLATAFAVGERVATRR
ncbi:hypothetical protein [Actinoplanes sp. NPDC023714]|uniref:hypothetical protein n=1 Tax=Actinoplanes sp. NPDC023714 TaxID=3154322 RepID=UPI0033D8E2F5